MGSHELGDTLVRQSRQRVRNHPTICSTKRTRKKPRKIQDFDTAGDKPFVVVPPYTAADINNTVYADYPFDAIKPGRTTASRASRSTSGTRCARASRSSTPIAAKT